MREIKFRSWDKLNKYFETGAPISAAYSGYIIRIQNPMRDCIMNVYTGLKDSKGAEIYEGDILKVAEEDGTFHVKVSFEDGGFFVDYQTGDFSAYLLGSFIEEMEDNDHDVIISGNIHENPELIK